MDGPILVNVGQMIDLAIGTPEVGVVDFNMLQTVLHVMAQQQQILGKYVELSKGITYQDPFDNTDRATINVQEIKIHEMADSFGITGRKGAVSGTQDQLDDDEMEDETLLIVERIPKAQFAPITEMELVEATMLSKGKMKPSQHRGRKIDIGSKQRSPRPDSATLSKVQEKKESLKSWKDGERRLSVATAQQFDALESKVNQLQEHVLGRMPKAEEMIEEVRSQTNVKSISEMWQSLNVSARLEATEAGLEKLSSLMQDLAQEYIMVQKQLKKSNPDFKVCVSQKLAELAGLEDKLSDLASEVADLRERIDSSQINSPLGSRGKKSLGDDDTQTIDALDDSSEVQKTEKNPASDKSADSVNAAISIKSAENMENAVSGRTRDNLEKVGKDIKTVQNEVENLWEALRGLKKKVKSQKSKVVKSRSKALREDVQEYGEIDKPRIEEEALSQSDDQLASEVGGDTDKPGSGESRRNEKPSARSDVLAISKRVRQLEKRVDKCCSKVSDVKAMVFKTSFETPPVQDKKPTVKIDPSIVESIETSMPKEMAGLGELFSKVQELQQHISSLNETALLLLQDREARQANMNLLLEQIEMLKICKVEREDVATVLASKADEVALAGKVSRNAFNIAYDDLTRGLQETMGRLAKQEMALQQTLESVQNEMENKLDKLEMSAVKEFIQSRLQKLHVGFKRLMEMRKQALAAGTKQKFLKNVNCLSCDAQVIQATTESPVMPVTRPMPTNYSMKAYLSYELDAMRKQRQGPVMQRNLHDWEDIEKLMKQRKQGSSTAVLRDAEGAHMCSRYCGGSHTMTAAQQRAARSALHSKLRFGPDVLNLSSGFGDDGKIYRMSARHEETKSGTKENTENR